MKLSGFQEDYILLCPYSRYLYGAESWVVSAEKFRLLQPFHFKCIRYYVQSVAPPHLGCPHCKRTSRMICLQWYCQTRYAGHAFRKNANRILLPTRLGTGTRGWVRVVRFSVPSGSQRRQLAPPPRRYWQLGVGRIRVMIGRGRSGSQCPVPRRPAGPRPSCTQAVTFPCACGSL